MIISNEYKGRHGFADFENKIFQITNKKEQPNVICELVKVPTYSFTRTYVEKICEGNGWYSKGDEITEKITHDFWWLVILDNKCLGVINQNNEKTLSNKYAIENIKFKQITNFIKSI